MDHGQVAGVVFFFQVGEVRDHLFAHQLPLVDDHLGGEAADVEILRFLMVNGAELVAGLFSNDVELALESVSL